MQLFYHPGLEITTKEVHFDREESRHISKVLRKKEGDLLQVTDGKGRLYNVRITIVDRQKISAEIENHQLEHPKPYKLHLAVAPTKMNDRYEWFLEKATEIGIDEITPIICEQSERKTVKTARFERILQSAMKQSLHYTLPILNPPIAFSEFVKSEKNEQLFIAHCEEQPKKPLQSSLKPTKDASILIGPEGDFSTEEIALATQLGFNSVSLGTSRLRTETAAIVACHTVAMVNEVPSL